MKAPKSPGLGIIKKWLEHKERKPFLFQEQAWNKIRKGESGLVNAPTGYGKTYSVFLGALVRYIDAHPMDYHLRTNNGLQLLWITPLRALAKDIGRAMEEVITELGMSWKIGIRNGDTPASERQQQKRKMPEVLIITPESLHLLLAQKNHPALFRTLQVLAVDEWHELLGSKRGVQVELAIARIYGYFSEGHNDPVAKATQSRHKKSFCVWGISATIGNLEEAKEVLLSPLAETGSIVTAAYEKKIAIESVFPDEIEKYPWAGHLGIRLAEKILPVLLTPQSTLLFINTRGMSERWYQHLLTISPELAGAIALHHGSIEHDLRVWVEEALHAGTLQAVVCTSSLDLGVDFRPVETVIQVGSPKGVARFLQRAGQ